MLLRHGDCGISSKAKELQSTSRSEEYSTLFHLRADGIRRRKRSPSTCSRERSSSRGWYTSEAYSESPSTTRERWIVLHALLSGFLTKHAATFVRINKRTRLHKRRCTVCCTLCQIKQNFSQTVQSRLFCFTRFVSTKHRPNAVFEYWSTTIGVLSTPYLPNAETSYSSTNK